MGARNATGKVRAERRRLLRLFPPSAAAALVAPLIAAAIFAHCPRVAAATHPPVAHSGACRVEEIAGEVRAGQSFEHPIGGGLKVLLEPIASGWILRILAAQGPRDAHDYAELATPPYHSVSPLSISTDFSFRAQDALAWNPRRFHFAADRKAFAQLQQLYDEYQRSAKDAAAHREVEAKLAAAAAQTPEAELILLDAHLVEGTADQAGTAAMVASHLNASSHQVDQPADGRSTPLGRLNWIRFRLRLSLPQGFRVPRGTQTEMGKCL